ncbi:transglycosylase SLT domain-containing protein [Burkholderia sp. PAMC 26561]|uniref:transglycosylase SLT domain-containing protein n=1 Tax=Burkholderia sp. PAMC 26561 TaxID=1795043 RepID=UPI00076B1093|nr:transglycosylase SLT domain-containing protein [Burkholderia sp. PAMC 26561]AME28713.1 lytic transglycosylase [Burkholderia sp. PAMC 26561]
MTNTLLAAALLLVGSACNAATIEEIISPTQFVVSSAGQRTILDIDGIPIYACGMKPFQSWAQRLDGQSLEMGQGATPTVNVDGAPVSLLAILVRGGWVQPSVLTDDAQAAMTERRGGWACASAQAPFDAMHSTVDPKILAGIALNESAYNGRAWPWTLNVAGRGFFFRTRDDAYRAIRILIADGRSDFDIGIMQVNWGYHSKRFASPWDALSPATNIHVAEEILNENYQKTHSAVKAVAYYHSANPQPGREYLARFVQHLSQIDRGL